MNFLENYYKKIIKKDLLNKFQYTNKNKLTELKKITLHFGIKNNSIKKTATSMLSLELLTKLKSKITISKRPNLFLKIQKGHPVGCKVILTKKFMYAFLEKLIVEIFPKIKNFQSFSIGVKNNNFFFRINCSDIELKELEEQYPLFSNLPQMDINIETNAQTRQELSFLIKSLKFPITEIRN